MLTQTRFLLANLRAVRPNVVLLLVVVVLGGCRTYGRYGNVKETKEQMRIAVDNFEHELQLAQGNLRQLESKRENLAGITSFVDAYEHLVARHALLVQEQKDDVERMATSDDYRPLARMYGAIISEQQVIAKQYESLLEGPRETADTALTVPGHSVPRGRYMYFPPFYQRMQRRLPASAASLDNERYLMDRSAAIDSVRITADGQVEDDPHAEESEH